MIQTKSFDSAIEGIVEYSPSCTSPTKVLAWAHMASDILSVVYPHLDAELIETRLIEAVKERDGYDDEE